MTLTHSKGLLRVLALFALLLFSGDLVADVVSDMSQEHCDLQTSPSAPCHDKAPCSHCACAAHTGAVVIGDFAMNLSCDSPSAILRRGADEATPPPLAASIDHPPQLA